MYGGPERFADGLVAAATIFVGGAMFVDSVYDFMVLPEITGDGVGDRVIYGTLGALVFASAGPYLMGAIDGKDVIHGR